MKTPCLNQAVTPLRLRAFAGKHRTEAVIFFRVFCVFCGLNEFERHRIRVDP
jgi:hypothetical protein